MGLDVSIKFEPKKGKKDLLDGVELERDLWGCRRIGLVEFLSEIGVFEQGYYGEWRPMKRKHIKQLCTFLAKKDAYYAINKIAQFYFYPGILYIECDW